MSSRPDQPGLHTRETLSQHPPPPKKKKISGVCGPQGSPFPKVRYLDKGLSSLRGLRKVPDSNSRETTEL